MYSILWLQNILVKLILPLYLPWSFLKFSVSMREIIVYFLYKFTQIYGRGMKETYILKYIICFFFLMETVKCQKETSVFQFAIEVWSWLTTSTIFHYTTFLYSTCIHLTTLRVWRSKESSQYESLDCWDGRTRSG